MCNIKLLNSCKLIGGLSCILLVTALGLLSNGCTQDSGGLFSSGNGKWRTFDSTQTAKTPAPAPKQATPQSENSLAGSRRLAPRNSTDPRAKAAEMRVNEEVELMQAMEQARKNQKPGVTPKPTPTLGDSDSLAAKLAQVTPTPDPTPTPTAVPTPIPTPVVSPTVKPTLTPAPAAERPVITPIRRAPVAAKKLPLTNPITPTPTMTPAPKPPVKEKIKITAVEPVPVSKKDDLMSVLDEKTSDPMLDPIDDKEDPLASIEPTPSSANTGAKLDVPDPDNPNAALDMLLFRLEDKLKDRPEDTGTQMKLRLIYAVLGQWQQALKDKGEKENAGGEFAKNIASLVKAFDNPDMSSAQQANQALKIVEQMQELLRKQADLVVSNLLLCREVSSYGSFKVMPPEYFVAGKPLPIIVYLELENFTSKFLSDKKIYQTLLSMTIEVLNENGRSIWRQRYERIEDTANKKRKDFYLAPQITLPAALPSGKVKLKITVEDLHGNKVAQRSIDLEIKDRR